MGFVSKLFDTGIVVCMSLNTYIPVTRNTPCKWCNDVRGNNRKSRVWNAKLRHFHLMVEKIKPMFIQMLE